MLNEEKKILYDDLFNTLEIIASDAHELAQFAFQLRWFDAKEHTNDYFTKKFLDYRNKNGDLAIKSEIWRKIILSNSVKIGPAKEDYEVFVDPNLKFRLTLGEQFQYTMRCDNEFTNHNNRHQPYIVSQPNQ